MKLKFTFLTVMLLGTSIYVKSQSLSSINLALSNHGTTITSVELFAGNNSINISLKGRAWVQNASDNAIGPVNKIPGATANSSMDYYDRFDDAYKTGKVKSAGDIGFDYYDRFDDEFARGKLKQAGKLGFTYYDRFDAEELRGKVKSIGNVNVTYYDKFDVDNIGKVKNIGNTTIVYYDRFDPVELRGKIKSIEGNSPQINVIGD
jgi:hypothetical protein